MTAAPTQAAPADVAAPDPAFVADTLAGAADTRTSSASVDAALFTGGTYVAQGVQFVAGLVQKSILGPVGSGTWALMQSFWTFMTITSLGAQPGATRQVPMLRGRGDYRAAQVTANTSATFSISMIAIAGVVLAIVALAFGSGWDEQVRWGVLLLGVTAPLRLFTDTHEVLIQCVKRFDIASATVVLKALLTLVFQTLAVLAFGVYGMFLGVVIVEALGVVYWMRIGIISFQRPAFRPQISWLRLKELISFGAPILVYAQVWLLFQAADSLIVAGALSLRQLGYYALAGSVTQYLLYLPRSIGGAVFPRMAETWGRTGRLEDIHHYATEVQRLLAYVMVPLAVGAAFFTFPVLIRHLLPAFDPAVDVVQIMVAASFFMALMNMPIKVLMTAGYRWSLTAIAFVCLLLNIGINVLMVVVLDLGLEGAATATAISYLVTFVLTTGYSLSRVIPPREVVVHLGEIVLVFVYLYGALRGIEALFGSAEGSLIADTALAALKFAILVVVMLPWLWLAERRVQGISRLRTLALKAVRRG